MSGDKQLAELLACRHNNGGEVWSVAESAEEGLAKLSAGRFDAVVVSDRLADTVPGDPVLDNIRRLAGKARLVMLLSNRHSAGRNREAAKECLADGWAVVPPGRSTGQVADLIGAILRGTDVPDARPQNGLIHFLGTTPNIGTTVAAFAAASAMASRTDRKIALLCLNLKSDKLHLYLGEPEPGLALDGLRPELKADLLTPERLLAQCRTLRRWPNLYILHGNRQREQADYYSVEEFDRLFRVAEQTFDLYIADTSAYWDNAATVSAMLHAGQRVLVTAPRAACYREDFHRWCKTLSPAFGLSPSDFDLLVTQKEEGVSASPRQIAKETGLPRIGEIRRDPELDRCLEEGRLAEWAIGESGGARDAARVAETLLLLREEKILPASRRKRTLDWKGIFRAGRRIGFAGR